MQQVGQDLTRVESREKVTGRIKYISDLGFPGMAHAMILRSASPHARFRIDATEARKMPGVVAVVTGADLGFLANPHYGPAFLDQTPLAIGKTRYVGEPLAAVVAESEAQAQDALSTIMVEYEDLPPVLSVQQAMADKENLVHDQVRASGNFADLASLTESSGSNVAFHYKLRKGDVEKAFLESDLVLEESYSVPATHHVAMETYTSIASVEHSGKITVWSTTQTPSLVRNQLALMFGIPLAQVRVVSGFLGGGYGEKTYYKIEPLVTVLSHLTRRTVRLHLSREEAFVNIKAPEVFLKIKSGVKRDGTLLARQVEIIWDCGATMDILPRVAQKSGYTGAGPYDIANVKIDSYCVYTNKSPSGPLRGFGVPPVVWAYESHTDEIAKALGLDPLEYRQRVLLEDGLEHATGTVMRSADFKGCLDAVARSVNWAEPCDQSKAPPGVIYAKGLAVGMKAVITPSASHAYVMMHGDGSVTLHSSSVDMGQGSATIFSQMVAQELGVPMSKVKVLDPDTDSTPFDQLTAGSRSTFHMGNAILLACANLREQLFKLAAKLMECDEEGLALADEIVSDPVSGKQMTLKQILSQSFVGGLSGNIVGHGTYQTQKGHEDHETGHNTNVTIFWFAGAVGVEIAVDTMTGQVQVLKCAVSGDVGYAINPRSCHQQLAGAAVLGLGLTLSEEMLYDGGQQINASLADYKIPAFPDVPPIDTYLITNAHAEGPYGAKGIGETGTLPVSPAIANALERATGVRIRSLPITPEKVLAALERRD